MDIDEVAEAVDRLARGVDDLRRSNSVEKKRGGRLYDLLLDANLLLGSNDLRGLMEWLERAPAPNDADSPNSWPHRARRLKVWLKRVIDVGIWT